MSTEDNTQTNGPTTGTAPKGKRRWGSGVVAKREIAKLARSTDNIFPKAPFERLVRELAADVRQDTRFAADGMEAVHEAAEQFVTDRIIKADLARRHAGRKTLHVDDLNFAAHMGVDTADLVNNACYVKEVQQHKVKLANDEARAEARAKAKAAKVAAETVTASA
eukprot:CAMPEP_0172004284 /NCGR_PEP_ID=MMETSP1041-20130122/4384_1 /TAXON_ID=464988 /ORGANISM="Hemiselmis andersenii, Strain CCMP439" /LENGTH=164 /DNA_ID=CAMNT_0012658107 /DNA_START=611 /DNA_END=1105 /DNA_ORIENTATION=-